MAARTSRLLMIGAAGSVAASDSTLVALHRPGAVGGMLDAAQQLMTREGGRITVLAIDGPALAGFQPTEEVLTGRRAAESSRRADWVKGMRASLDDWVARERRAGHPARWIAIRGDGALAVIEHGRRAHLLVLEQNPADRDARVRVHAALARAARPVLLVPAGHTGGFGRVAAVAWDDDGSAVRAVRTARHLLARAARVVVLQVSAAPVEQPLPDLFDGLPIERVTVPADGRDVGIHLLAMARDAGADLLVMGSRSHGRLREMLLDGVTESVVAHADLPVLLQHQETRT